MRKRFILLSAILYLLVIGAISAGAQSVQDLIAQAGTAKDYSGSPAVIVFDKTSVEVKDSGLSLVNRDYLVKILTLEGIKRFHSLRFDYDPASNMIEIRDVLIHRKNGTTEKVDMGKNIYERPQPQSSIIWGARMKVVALPRLEPGDAVQFKTFKKGFEIAYLAAEEEDERYMPPLRGEFYDKVYFADDLPIKLKSYELKMPLGKPFQFNVYNGELVSSKKFDDKFNYYSWLKTDAPVYRGNRVEVGFEDTVTKLVISSLPGWEEKSVWFYNANKNQFEVNDEIRAKVRELTAGLQTDEEKVAALNHWVAQYIRYMGLTMGKGEGYTVHSGKMTFQDRCGVCKDKAGMLATMLYAAGFEARVAMTMAGGKVEDVPADQFNHCVTIWKRGVNNYVLLDPTWIPYSREMWSSAEQEQQYLIGDEPGVDLRTTPRVPAEQMLIEVSDDSSLDAKGNLTGKIHIIAHGYPEQRLRRLLAGYSNGRIEDYFTEIVSVLSPSVEVQRYTYTNPVDFSKPLEIEIEYSIKGYAYNVAGKTLFVPPLAKNPLRMPYVSRWFGYAGPEKRENMVDNWGTFDYRFEGKTAIPAGMKIEIMPEKKEISGPLADYNLNISRDANSIKVKQEIKIKKRFIPVDEYSNYRDALRAFNEAGYAFILLGKEGGMSK